MKPFFTSIFLLLFCCSAIAQTPAATPAAIPPAYDVKAHYTKMEQYITMRDGVRLFTSIYLPKDQSKKYPIMMSRTPYNVSPYGEAYKSSLGPSPQYMMDGFIFVYQDVRGRYMSEGEFVNVRPIIANKTAKQIDESTDTYDTIDWLVKNLPNNNGRVGITGISYPGFYSTAALPGAHPALKAVSPQAPVTDWFMGDDFHHKGAFFLMDAFNFLGGFGVPRPKPVRPDQITNQIRTPIIDNYKFYLNTGALPNFNAKYYKDSVKFWNEMMDHPNYDAFWQEMNIRPKLTNVKPAVLTVGGFFDAEDAYGALEVYKAIEKQNPQSVKNMLVMGPWFHGGWNRGDGDIFGDINFGQKTSVWYRENVELPFFNYYLKDIGKGNELPEATIFLTGSNEFKKFDTWPPKNVEEKNLYFLPGGKLSFTPPAAATGINAYDEYVSDPAAPVPYQDGIQARRTREYMLDDQRFAERRPDVKTYQTDVLTEDLTLTGPVIANLLVSTTGTDADYVVKLIDVFPDNFPNPVPNPKGVVMGGYEMLVRGEIMRGRFRNSFEKPEAFVPGKVTKVNYPLPDVGHVFKKGHRIMIQIQNSWFPLADRNPQKFVPNINKAKDSDFQKATHRIYHDAAHPSSVKLTVMK